MCQEVSFPRISVQQTKLLERLMDQLTGIIRGIIYRCFGAPSCVRVLFAAGQTNHLQTRRRLVLYLWFWGAE